MLQADLAKRLALENTRRRLEIPDERALDEANERALDEAFMADNEEGAVGGPPVELLGPPVVAEEPLGLNLVNQVDPPHVDVDTCTSRSTSAPTGATHGEPSTSTGCGCWGCTHTER